MNDITINNNGSQNENQKTTPVTESSLELNCPSLSLPGDVFQIWLWLWVWYKMRQMRHDSNPQLR